MSASRFVNGWVAEDAAVDAEVEPGADGAGAAEVAAGPVAAGLIEDTPPPKRAFIADSKVGP